MKLCQTKKKQRKLQACEQGVAFIEFALSVTVLIIMFFGAVEISRYILIVQKVEKTIDTLADVFTQSQTQNVTPAQVSQYLNASQQLMSPYPMGTNGIVILTDINTYTTANPIVSWQVCGGGTLASPSQVAASPVNGSVATLPLPDGFVMNANEEVVAGEMYYQFTPIVAQGIVPSATIYRVAYFKPRFQQNLTATSAASCP